MAWCLGVNGASRKPSGGRVVRGAVRNHACKRAVKFVDSIRAPKRHGGGVFPLMVPRACKGLSFHLRGARAVSVVVQGLLQVIEM